MKKQKEKNIVDLDQFDQTVSLYQLLPSGTGVGLKRLKTIVNSIHHSQVEQSKRPLSLLISGSQGTRTHARSFLRALGLDYTLEMPAEVLQSSVYEVHNFFSPTRQCDSYIISSFSLLFPSVLKTIYEVVSAGEFSVKNSYTQTTEVVPVLRPLIMTTHNKDKVPQFFQEKVGHIVELEDYTEQELQLIILQRLKYANIEISEDEILHLIVEYGCKKLIITVRLLKDAITVMLADGRKTLTVADVKKAMAYS